MAYKVIILYRLYMPSYFLGTFTEYPYTVHLKVIWAVDLKCCSQGLQIEIFFHLQYTLNQRLTI